MKRLDTSQSSLVEELKQIVIGSKSRAIANVNSIITMMYWEVGNKINHEILDNKRAEYGKEIVVTVSRELRVDFGRGFEEKNLRRMMQFAKSFDKEKVATLSRQLSWSHFLVLLPIQDNIKREFYLQMSIGDQWSVRVLRERANSLLYERTILSKKPEELIAHELQELRKGNMTSGLVLKDPYLLDFLDLKDTFLEKDLEDAILRQIEEFILELGSGFSFIARQKRIQLDGDDYYIDILFYNRKLNRLIVIDLKIGEFKAEYKGQMELYLRWLDKYERQKEENKPIGIIMCTGKKEEQIELLELEKSSIHVAEYLTVLPPKEILQAKLQSVLQNAKEKLETPPC